MTGATSYIADVSSEEERTFRIGKGNLRAIYLCIIILFVLSEGSNTARQETKTRRAIREWELERKGVIKG